MPIDEVTENLFLVTGANRGRFPFSLSILATGDRNVLFDTWCGSAALEELKDLFDIDLVVNSHTHPDHFSGNGHFAGVELRVPEMFAGMLPDLEKMSVRLAGGGEASEQWLFFVRHILEHTPVEPTGGYVDGDMIETGELSFEAIHTPGHTADHFCFFERARGILLSSDFDLTPFGPWYGHQESDLGELHQSFQKIKDLGPSLIVSSHRDPVSRDIEGELRRYEEIVEQRGERVLELISSEPVRLNQLAASSPIYGMNRSNSFALYRYFEARMIEKHLEALALEGKAEQDAGRYWRKRG
jgi:glyoxylase-like metal-dependent hydrolase (beta-lactamase superfamily II)